MKEMGLQKKNLCESRKCHIPGHQALQTGCVCTCVLSNTYISVCILYSHLGNVATKGVQTPQAEQWHKELSLMGGFHSGVLLRNSLLVEGAAPQVEEVERGCVRLRARPIKRERREGPGLGWPRLGADSGGGGGGRLGRVRDGDV